MARNVLLVKFLDSPLHLQSTNCSVQAVFLVLSFQMELALRVVLQGRLSRLRTALRVPPVPLRVLLVQVLRHFVLPAQMGNLLRMVSALACVPPTPYPPTRPKLASTAIPTVLPAPVLRSTNAFHVPRTARCSMKGAAFPHAHNRSSLTAPVDLVKLATLVARAVQVLVHPAVLLARALRRFSKGVPVCRPIATVPPTSYPV